MHDHPRPVSARSVLLSCFLYLCLTFCRLGACPLAQCLAMLDQFSVTQQKLHREIWEVWVGSCRIRRVSSDSGSQIMTCACISFGSIQRLMMSGDVYATCTHLGKCQADPSPTELTECHRVRFRRCGPACFLCVKCLDTHDC